MTFILFEDGRMELYQILHILFVQEKMAVAVKTAFGAEPVSLFIGVLFVRMVVCE